jgi:quaternary ammonium compound-resistance protein SugE
MTWFLLVIAGLLEVLWAYSMKQSRGFTLLAPSLVTLAGMVASFTLLSLSMKTLPLGTAYTVWTGIGALGAFAVGVIVLGEQLTAARALGGLFVIAGLVILNVASEH